MAHSGKTKAVHTGRLVAFAFLFSCLAFMASVSFAKTKSAITKDAEKSVAKWDVSINGSNNSIDLVAGGDELNYPLTVSNDSEVASDCVITLTGIPSGVVATLAGDGFQNPMSGRVVESKIIFDNNDALSLEIGAEKNYIISFSAPLEASANNGTDIAVDVTFIQKDPQP